MNKQSLSRGNRRTSVLITLASLVAFSLPSAAMAMESCRLLSASQLSAAVLNSDNALWDLKDRVNLGLYGEALNAQLTAPESMRPRVQMLMVRTGRFIRDIESYNVLDQHRLAVAVRSSRLSREEISDARRFVGDFIAYLPSGSGSFTPAIDARIEEARQKAAAFMRASEQVNRHNECLRVITRERAQDQHAVAAASRPLETAVAPASVRGLGQDNNPCPLFGPPSPGRLTPCVSNRNQITAPAIPGSSVEPAAPFAGAASMSAGVGLGY